MKFTTESVRDLCRRGGSVLGNSNKTNLFHYREVKDGKVVDSIEVTSLGENKDQQMAKEERIRDSGGNFIKDNTGNLIEMPENIHTRIERR